MIIVLDTNVIVSGLLSPGGPPARILEAWEKDQFDVAVSVPLLEELKRALAYPRVRKAMKRSPEWIGDLLRRLSASSIVVESTKTVEVIREDPDDNRVLECAAGARAAYVVSGDEHLVSLESWQGIMILTPAAFLRLLEAAGAKPHLE